MRSFKITYSGVTVGLIVGLVFCFVLFWSTRTSGEPQKSKIIYFSQDYVLDPVHPEGINKSDLSSRLDPPVSYDNFLSYSFRMSEMSRELSDIFRELLNKDIRLNINASSYVGQKSMVTITEDLIYIQVYSDMASTLNRDEIFAFAIHEIAHIFLGHYDNPALSKRDMYLEIAADIWTVNKKGIDPAVLISGLSKLKSLEEERTARINILKAFIAE